MVWIDTTAHGVELAGIVHVHALIVHVHGEQAQRRGDALVRPVGSGLVDAKEVIEHYAARAVASRLKAIVINGDAPRHTTVVP